MAKEEKPDCSSEKPSRGRGLPIGKLLLPAGLLAGTIAGAYVMREAFGLSTMPSWLVGGPLGAIAGLLAAFLVLVVLNAGLRMARRR